MSGTGEAVGDIKIRRVKLRPRSQSQPEPRPRSQPEPEPRPRSQPEPESLPRSQPEPEPPSRYHFYRCTWNGKFTKNEKEELKSPVFTIPCRADCQWYLSSQHLESNGQISFSTRLYLDRDSDCQAAVAKFKLQVGNSKAESVRSSSSRTFKFVKNSENSAAIMSVIPAKYFQRHMESEDEDDNVIYYGLTVYCTIMVMKVMPEDVSLSRDLKLLWKKYRFPDFIIQGGPWKKLFRVHKDILAARSSVFATIFAPKSTENQNEFHIREFSKEIVEHMLEYIYTGEIDPVELNNNANVYLELAQKYGLDGLKSKCEEVLIESLSSSNVFERASLAKSCKARNLRSESAHLIWREKTKIMKTSGWESFSQTNPEFVRNIMIDDNFHPKTESCASDTDDSFSTMPSSENESKKAE